MKVLLKQDIDNVGYAGEVMKVADGYGRNYLIPQGLAVKATPSVLKNAHAWRERAAVRMVELKKEHEALAARISEARLEFTARAGETGKLYGSVTTADVVEQLNDSLGTDIDRRSLVGGPLRQLGEHKVTVRLSRDYQPQVTVTINQFIEEVEEIEEVDDEEAEELAEATDEAIIAASDEEAEVEEPVAEVDEVEELVAEETVAEETVAEEAAVEEAAVEEAEVEEAAADEDAGSVE